MDKLEPIGILNGSPSTILSLSEISDGQDDFLISTSHNGEVGVWDVSENELQQMDKTGQKFESPLMIIGTHELPATGSASAGNSQFLTCGWDETVKLWDIECAKLVNLMKGDTPYMCIDYSSINRLCAVGTKQKSVQFMDPQSNDLTISNMISDCHTSCVACVKWCPGDLNYLMTAGWDGLAYIWDHRKLSQPSSTIHKSKERIMSSCWKDNLILIGTDKGNVYSYTR
ncbi:Ribosome biogenesis protein WDR12 [Thelohanellus kitauei]|uniref:Ribosome biogenesis protein WDR12 n=1 Tax=Thelohanellus kitauei TaxID=669202 RepID=A0A0C2NCQ0_THEKT|nr:Ribosome biogenesis protein WDR12 [Thelohanellus kitauei]